MTSMTEDLSVAEPPRPPGSRRQWLEAGVFVAALVALLAGAALWGSARERPDAGRAFDIVRLAPAPAPDVTLRDLDGRPVRLADFRGRVVFLNFWATWCAPCREELPAMEALARDLADRGLVVLVVNYEESGDVVRAFARETDLALPALLDADGAAARRYGVTVLPASFFVDRRGAMVGSVLGFRDWRSPAARAYLHGLLGRAD
jgi:thiol-disulfide isomerase/thioredoxin